MSLHEFIIKARNTFQVEKFEISYTDPISFLYSLKWDIPNGGAFSEEIMTQMNIDFDEYGCFGRAVKAAVLAEIFFPEQKLYAGEVCEDLLRDMLLEQARQEPWNWNDETFVGEILQYENPHIVIIDKDGNQFDPLFGMISGEPEKMRHPAVLEHSIWEGLHSSYLVSNALRIMEEDKETYLRQLLQANILYPEVILIKENLIHAYCLNGQEDKGIMCAREAAKKRKDAKTLWVLWQLIHDEAYKNQIIKEYDIQMFNFLTKMF